MENDLIREVVRFEEELNRQAAAEAERSHAWLEEARTRLEEEFSQRQQALEQESARALATARDEAQREAAALVARAEARAAALEGIDQELLKEFIRQHIFAILPGRRDDHPDVEG
jgi:vacuolar-type H+-ATPase subunit H